MLIPTNSTRGSVEAHQRHIWKRMSIPHKDRELDARIGLRGDPLESRAWRAFSDWTGPTVDMGNRDRPETCAYRVFLFRRLPIVDRPAQRCPGLGERDRKMESERTGPTLPSRVEFETDHPQSELGIERQGNLDNGGHEPLVETRYP